MRFLFVLYGDNKKVASLGGAERQAILLANEMLINNNEVFILYIAKTKGNATQMMDDLNIPYKLCPFMIKFSLLHYLNFIFIIKSIRCFNPHAVFSYTTYINLYVGIASYFVSDKIRFIWGQRDEGLGLTNNFFTNICKRNYSNFIANASGGAIFLKDVLNVDESKIHIIHNAVALKTPNYNGKYRAMFNIPCNSFIVAMVANLHKNKDHITLIHAWKLFKSTEGLNSNDSFLLLVGRKDSEFVSLSNLVTSLGLTDSVIFTGEIYDISNLFSDIDLLVHSSKSEGLSNAILEAMGSGIPVLATDISGNRECLGSETLLETLTPVGDPFLMSERIHHLLNTPSLSNIISEYNIKRVQRLFSIDSLYKNTMNLLNID